MRSRVYLKRKRCTMNNKKQITKKQILAFVLLSIIPILAVLLGLVLLIKANTIINITFLLAFVFLPALAISLFALVTFLVKKLFVKIILSILILALFVGSFLGVDMLGKYEELRKYENDEIKTHYAQHNRLMPELSEITQPKKLEYYDYYSSALMGLFTCDVDALICKYDEDTYSRQKALLEEKYVFQTDAVKGEPTTEIDGYYFRMLSKNEYEMNYPKEVVLFATNDETNEIVYMSFYDYDLDSIDSLDEFILEDCGWQYIR